MVPLEKSTKNHKRKWYHFRKVPKFSNKKGTIGARADFDIFTQGGWRVCQGGWKFSAANATHSAPLGGTSLASSNGRLSDILEIHFLDLFRYIFCKGTNKTTMDI